MNRKKITLNEELSRMKQLFGHMGIPSRLIKEAITGGPGTGTLALRGLESSSEIAIALPRASEALRLGFISSLEKAKITGGLEGMKTKFGGTMEEAAAAFLKTLPEVEQTTLLSKFSGVASEENIAALTGLEKAPSVEVSVKDLASDVRTMLEKRKTSGGELTQSELILINDSIKTMESKAAGNTSITNVVNGVKAEVELLQTPATTDLKPIIDKLITMNPELAGQYNKATAGQIKIAEDLTKNLTDEQALTNFKKLNEIIKDDQVLNPILMASFGGGGSSFGRFLRRANDLMFDLFERAGQSKGGTIGCLKYFVIIIFTIVGVTVTYMIYQYANGDEELPKIELPTLDSADKNCLDKVEGFSTLTEEQQKYAAVTFGCARTKKDETDNKVVFFEKESDTKFKIRTKGECIEVHSAPSADSWIEGKVSGTRCGAPEPEPEPEPELKPEPKPEDTDNNDDENTTSCEHTLDDFKDALINGEVSFTSANWDQKTCTGTYSYDGKTYGPYDISLTKISLTKPKK